MSPTDGMIHGLAGLAAFSLLAVTAFVMAWHFAGTRERGWAIYSAGVGLLIFVFFIAGSTASAMDANGTWPNAPSGFFQRWRLHRASIEIDDQQVSHDLTPCSPELVPNLALSALERSTRSILDIAITEPELAPDAACDRTW